MRRLLAAALLIGPLLAPAALFAGAETPPADGRVFPAIEGGEIALSGPTLVVNTASMCGYTYQYAGLQELQDAYAAKGLTVLAAPSDDFNQEYGSNAEVKEFCAVNYGLTLPMTEIIHVRGEKAHPFYRWLKAAHGVEPSWNFNKALIDGEGRLVGFWGSGTKPMSADITGAVEKVLAGG
mgnify:CR=1 FL=1